MARNRNLPNCHRAATKVTISKCETCRFWTAGLLRARPAFVLGGSSQNVGISLLLDLEGSLLDLWAKPQGATPQGLPELLTSQENVIRSRESVHETASRPPGAPGRGTRRLAVRIEYVTWFPEAVSSSVLSSWSGLGVLVRLPEYSGNRLVVLHCLWSKPA